MCHSYSRNFIAGLLFIFFGVAIILSTVFHIKINLWPFGVAVFLIWRGLTLLGNQNPNRIGSCCKK